jgi:hypothetical protein
LARTTLLSTPNSLASSYTRTFATALLLGPGCGARTGLGCVRAHRWVLIERSRASRRVSFFLTSHPLLEPSPQRTSVERPRQAKCPRKRPTALG